MCILRFSSWYLNFEIRQIYLLGKKQLYQGVEYLVPVEFRGGFFPLFLFILIFS